MYHPHPARRVSNRMLYSGLFLLALIIVMACGPSTAATSPPPVPTDPPAANPTDPPATEESVTEEQPPTAEDDPAQPTSEPPAPPAVELQQELDFGIGGGGGLIACQACCPIDHDATAPVISHHDDTVVHGFLCMDGFQDYATLDIALYGPDNAYVETETLPYIEDPFFSPFVLIRKWVGIAEGTWTVIASGRTSNGTLVEQASLAFDMVTNPTMDDLPRVDIYPAPYTTVSPFFGEEGDCSGPYSASSAQTIAGSGFAPDADLVLGVYALGISPDRGTLAYQISVTTNSAGEFTTTLDLSDLQEPGTYAFVVYDISDDTYLSDIAVPICFDVE